MSGVPDNNRPHTEALRQRMIEDARSRGIHTVGDAPVPEGAIQSREHSVTDLANRQIERDAAMSANTASTEPVGEMRRRLPRVKKLPATKRITVRKPTHFVEWENEETGAITTHPVPRTLLQDGDMLGYFNDRINEWAEKIANAETVEDARRYQSEKYEWHRQQIKMLLPSLPDDQIAKIQGETYRELVNYVGTLAMIELGMLEYEDDPEGESPDPKAAVSAGDNNAVSASA